MLSDIWTCPRPRRLLYFFENMGRATDREYWTLLRELWIGAEFPNRDRQSWLRLFTSSRDERACLMEPEDYAAFYALPDPVRVYRGAEPRYVRGMSWTVDEERARWFTPSRGRPSVVNRLVHSI
jgi:hypothetical protein